MSIDHDDINSSSSEQVQSRGDSFVDRVSTRIWQETPEPHNAYLTSEVRCHGYDLMDLMSHRRFVDVLYLLFRGELPGKDEANLLETLMIALINPGPRHPATRAAMNAGIGKTLPEHILPISLAVMGGNEYAGEIEESMRFLRKNLRANPDVVASGLRKHWKNNLRENQRIGPGFGSRFNGIDPMPGKIANLLVAMPASGPALKWGKDFARIIESDNLGWLITGVAAATFCDLGFQPRVGAGLFQIMTAPGLLAHGIELANKPITAMPFVSDDHYDIQR